MMRALVTGATGFVGGYLVRALIARGDTVRVLSRTAGRAAALAAAGAEVRLGDVAEASGLLGAADGIDTVFHLVRSPTSASKAEFERVDVQGTENMLREARRAGVRRFVYVGTLAGYPLTGRDSAAIDEKAAFDESGLLGNYVQAKARAEALVLAAADRGADGRARFEPVIVRLGLVCGVGTSVFPAHVCQSLSGDRVILFGDGAVPLPLVYIDNAVDALVLAATVPDLAGESFNIVDEEVLTQGEYLELLRRTTGGRPQVLRLPRLSYYALGWVSELAAAARGKEPTTNRYRIKMRLAHVRWDCSKAKSRLGWRSRVPLREGLRTTFERYAGK
jgi:nucleoside-diphosphate-sugar epimerase